jgi:hypothetical protein
MLNDEVPKLLVAPLRDKVRPSGGIVAVTIEIRDCNTRTHSPALYVNGDGKHLLIVVKHDDGTPEEVYRGSEWSHDKYVEKCEQGH